MEKEIARAAKAAGGTVLDNPGLVQEVTYLVETPTGIPGEFEKQNLELPREVVISEMRNHQRYFAVVDGAGKLKNRFVAVAGTPVKDPKVARHGYERVLRARLADARFFFEEDRKKKLARPRRGARPPDLPGEARERARPDAPDRRRRRARWHAALGKEELVADAARGRRGSQDRPHHRHGRRVPRAAGDHGRALRPAARGCRPEIADAIEDHYRPIGASEEMPRGDLGALVGLADRLHQLVGIIGVGEKATGAADPFGLRRAAIGILRILLDRGYHLSLSAAVERDARRARRA